MADITIVFMGFINQRSHHWGGTTLFGSKRDLPGLVKLQKLWKDPPILMGKSTISSGPCSIAMLNYQRSMTCKTEELSVLIDHRWVVSSGFKCAAIAVSHVFCLSIYG